MYTPNNDILAPVRNANCTIRMPHRQITRPKVTALERLFRGLGVAEVLPREINTSERATNIFSHLFHDNIPTNNNLPNCFAISRNIPEMFSRVGVNHARFVRGSKRLTLTRHKFRPLIQADPRPLGLGMVASKRSVRLKPGLAPKSAYKRQPTSLQMHSVNVFKLF